MAAALLAGIALAVLVRWISIYYLQMPLPSNLKVEDIPPERAPKKSAHHIGRNEYLHKTVILHQDRIPGAALDADGSMYMLDKYGNVFTAPSDAPSAPLSGPIAYVGPGRPLGHHVSNGAIIICDSLKGLTSLDLQTGRLTILANRVSETSPLQPSSPIIYANDLDISSDGAIFFSDSTSIPPALNRAGFYDTMMSYLLTTLHGGGTGRLLVYLPGKVGEALGETHVLVEGIMFANGVALSEDESFVIVVETCGKRVWKHWLTGPQAGSTEILIEGLPGFPDGAARAADGSFWVTLIVPDQPVQAAVASGGRMARWITSWIIQSFAPPMKKYGMVIKVSAEGELLQTLQDPDGSHVNGISGVMEKNGKLYMGHLMGSHVSVLDLKDVAS